MTGFQGARRRGTNFGLRKAAGIETCALSGCDGEQRLAAVNSVLRQSGPHGNVAALHPWRYFKNDFVHSGAAARPSGINHARLPVPDRHLKTGEMEVARYGTGRFVS